LFKTFVVATSLNAFASTALAQTSGGELGIPRLSLRLDTGNAPASSPATPADASSNAPFLDTGTGYLVAGWLVMAFGVAVIVTGIGVSVASEPPASNSFLAKFTPAEGYVAAGVGTAVVGVGVLLVWIGLNNRDATHRPTWNLAAAYSPATRTSAITLARAW
jgi:hypothetical protein